jgi:ribonuclease HI
VKLTVHVDGGARGHPGPAAAGAVIRDESGEILLEVGEKIGIATNNVAEYKALLLGIARAKELGAERLELIGDSELIVKQVRGEYRVKDQGLKPLHAEVRAALEPLEEWSIKHVRREHNVDADRLVNATLDGA